MPVFPNVKKSVLSIAFSLLMTTAFGSHMNGGNIMYQYVGPGSTAGSGIYKITLILYKDNNCSGCPVLPQYARIVVFSSFLNTVHANLYVGLTSSEVVPIKIPFCLQNGPLLDYVMGKYTVTVDLPKSSFGYTVTYQACCRSNNLANVVSRYTLDPTVGATYFTVIPGGQIFPPDFTDNSPVFTKEIPVICANKRFSFNMGAVDPDGDRLEYSFANAFESRFVDSTDTPPLGGDMPAGPQYHSVTYAAGFSGTSPLGPDVSIDFSTGMISGFAPAPGKYLVSVLVNAYKYPPPVILSTSHRKDFVVTVAPCDVPGVFFKQGGFVNCKDSTIAFENMNNSDLNTTFDWDFGDPASGPLNYSSLAAPVHTFSAPGNYTIKLIVNKGTVCADSGTTTARIYPGFYGGFGDGTPQCVKVPVHFTDTTKTGYGTVNYWSWDFGDYFTTSHTSSAQNPTYTYNYAGSFNVRMIVGSDKGCRDTVDKVVSIIDKPEMSIGNDTLICSIDAIQLKATVAGAITGTITWSPNYMINDIHSYTPVVSPDVTTTYYATFSNNLGCRVTDSVKVSVVDFVTLHTPADTTICTSDAIKLAVISDGLKYVWAPSTDLDNPFIKNPIARPSQSRVYQVTASIGGCSSTASVSIKTVNYPLANAGPDSSICFGTSAYLHASGGAYYAWSPAAFLTAANIPNPVSVDPYNSVKYVVTVRDTLGCPKPVRDTVIITVINIKADAGPKDTAVVIGQPLQLNATGATNYVWEPATWLNNPGISDPIALPENNIRYILRAMDASGCYGLDSINVKLYKLAPGLYIPNAFTPNGDGINDLFRPTLLGMKLLTTFRIYNRSGQLVYSGTDARKGWDGNFRSQPQSAGTFVWYAEGVSYQDKKIQQKGYVVLIR